MVHASVLFDSQWIATDCFKFIGFFYGWLTRTQLWNQAWFSCFVVFGGRKKWIGKNETRFATHPYRSWLSLSIFEIGESPRRRLEILFILVYSTIPRYYHTKPYEILDLHTWKIWQHSSHAWSWSFNGWWWCMMMMFFVVIDWILIAFWKSNIVEEMILKKLSHY